MYTYLEEDKQFKGNLIKFVETNFLLSINLCRRYACLLFLLYSKFNITSKRRLLNLSCVAVEKSSALVIAFILPESLQFNKVRIPSCTDSSDFHTENGVAYSFCYCFFVHGISRSMNICSSYRLQNRMFKAPRMM